MLKSLNDFAFNMQGFASFLGGIQGRLGTKVIWRGSNSLELAMHIRVWQSTTFTKRAFISLMLSLFLTSLGQIYRPIAALISKLCLEIMAYMWGSLENIGTSQRTRFQDHH